MNIEIRSPFRIKKATTPEPVEAKNAEIFYPVQFSSTDISTIAEWFTQRTGQIETTTPMGQQTAYNNCEIVQSIIDRKASYMTTGKLKCEDQNDKEVTNASSKAVIKLLNNPNPIQSWREFISMITVYTNTYGYCPIYKVMPVNRNYGLPAAIWAIEPTQWTFTLTGKQYNQTRLQDIVASVSFTNYAGDMLKLEGEQLNDIIIINGRTPRTKTVPLIAQSPLYALKDVINNFQIGLNVYGTLLKQSILGIIANKAKDNNAGVIPLPKAEKDDINSKLATRYGIIEGRQNYIITNRDLAFQSMLTNVGNLQIPEMLRQSVDEACNKLNFQKELLSNEGVTYENKRSAEIMQYQNDIVPFAEYVAQYLTVFLQLEGFAIEICYDHLPFLQVDQKTRSETIQKVSTAYQMLFNRGGCTLNEWREELELEPLPAGIGDKTILEFTPEQIAKLGKDSPTPITTP